MPIFVIDEKWKDRLEKMWAWQRNFRASGDGVTFKNAPDGATVTVRQQPGKGTSRSSPDTLIVKVTGNATGSGWYTGNVWLPPADAPDPSSDLTEASLGSAGGACYYANLRETGASTHDLTDSENTKQKLFYGHFRGTAADGKPIYVGGDPWMENCT